MQLADRDLLRNVVFIGVSKGDKFQAVATGFIVGVRGAPGKFAPYLVTAQHVIAELHARGHQTVLWRANRTDGSSVVHSTDIAHWTVHPDSGSTFVDVAVVPTGKHAGVEEAGTPLVVHMGISIVTPAQRLLETLNHPRLVEQRRSTPV